MSAIDNKMRTEPPLDFSFCSLATCADALGEMPRITSPRKQKQKPEPLYDEDGEHVKAHANSLRLNNNALEDLSSLPATVQSLFFHPECIKWLDLSFNLLKTIDDCILDFEQLQILYLQGNMIDNLEEVHKLSALEKLRKLALHGNPIENTKGYRPYVLARIPQLQVFDCSCVTKNDKATAKTLQKFNKNSKKKKEKSEF